MVRCGGDVAGMGEGTYGVLSGVAVVRSTAEMMEKGVMKAMLRRCFASWPGRENPEDVQRRWDRGCDIMWSTQQWTPGERMIRAEVVR